MTVASLRTDIAKAQADFDRLNSRHWWSGAYTALPARTEKRIIALAERLARLHRFHGWLASKTMIEI